jgi:hypothetical protein
MDVVGTWVGPVRRPLSGGQQADLSLFDGFPYLVTRVVPAMYHIILLPEDASELDLAALARAQWRANRLETCLVTSPQKAWYISADGVDTQDPRPPRGGALVTGKLMPPTTIPNTVDLEHRSRRLTAIVDERSKKGGYLLGDLTAGAREATADDVARLAGAGPEGLPRGLERCARCGEWRGTCLRPSNESVIEVITADCRCQADNCCAACGHLLNERKLNANYYDPRAGHFVHVPGFSGLKHQCPPPAASKADAIPPRAR